MSDSKTVFALRKEGKLDEALVLSRQLIDATPSDPWVIRAYGWTLYDAVKRAEKEKKRQDALELMVEFNKLQIPEDDEILLKQRGHYQVTLLGSETHLADGLKRARQKVRDYPSDLVAIRDYAWILCDGITHATNIRNGELAAKLCRELNVLRDRIPQSEEALLKKVEWCRRMADTDPLSLLLRQAAQASKDKQTDQALAFYGEALKVAPDSQEAAEGQAWEITKKLGQLSVESDADIKAALNLIDLYFDSLIEHVTRPSNLHSLMLRRLTKFAEKVPLYIDYVRRWDTRNFQEDDFQRFRPEGKDRDFDSLVECVIKAVYRAAKAEKASSGLVRAIRGEGHGYDDTMAWAAAFVGEMYERFPAQIWFPYYYGQLLIRSGDPVAARGVILDTVRRKRGEFWAWHNLASTFTDEEGEARLACLCRALLCRVQDESYLVKVRLELAQALEQAHRLPEAKHEIEQVVRIRQQNEWMITTAVTALMKRDWYSTTNATTDNTSVYREFARKAEEVLYSDAEWVRGVITGRIPPVDDRPGRVVVGFMVGADLQESLVSEKLLEGLGALIKGSPVRITMEERQGRTEVAMVAARDGSPWDVIPVRVGLVTHVNTERGITAITLARTEFCLVRHVDFPAATELHPGDAVATQVRLDRRRNQLIPLTVEKTEQDPSQEFAKRFDGHLKIGGEGRFGFVNDVYIPEGLLRKMNTPDGSVAVGQAICEWNERKNAFTWRAITISAKGQNNLGAP